MSKFAFGKTKLALVAVAALAAMSSAQAVTDSTTLGVSLTLTNGCQFNTASTSAVAFPETASTSTLAAPVVADGALNVTCTSGTNYTIGLDGGLNNTSGSPVAPIAGSRRMQLAATGNYVPYELYRNAARSDVWGTDVGANVLGGSGSGNAESIPVYGKVSSVNAVAGVYTDTVTATITY
jgi:spore coat protein U-like protein